MNQNRSLSYAITLYDKMFEHSKMIDSRNVPELRLPSLGMVRLYNGKMKDLAEELKFSVSQVHNAAGILYRVQALTRLLHSTPFGDGWWMLNFNPTMEQLIQHNESIKQTSRRIAPSRLDVVLSDMTDLRIRVKKLEDLLADHIRGSQTMS